MKLSLRKRIGVESVVSREKTLGDVVVLPNFETTFELQERDIEEFQRAISYILNKGGLVTKYEKDFSRQLYVPTKIGLVFDGFDNTGFGSESLKDFYLTFKGATSDQFRVDKNHTLFSFLKDNKWGYNKGIWISTSLPYVFGLNPWASRVSAAYVKE